MNLSNRHSAFTQPLIPFAPTAHWIFHDEAGVAIETLYQFGPRLVTVPEVVDYLIEAHKVRFDDPRQVLIHVPGEHTPRRAIQGRFPYGAESTTFNYLVPPKTPTAKAFWTYWSEVETAGQILSTPRRARSGWRKKGHVWSVFPMPDGTVEGTFVTHDHKGLVNPVFDVSRRPFHELTDALTVTDRIAEFFDVF